MELQYVKVQKFDRGVLTCPYNEGCQCTSYQRVGCYRCGWNPKVAQKRSEKILGKMEGKV